MDWVPAPARDGRRGPRNPLLQRGGGSAGRRNPAAGAILNDEHSAGLARNRTVKRLAEGDGRRAPGTVPGGWPGSRVQTTRCAARACAAVSASRSRYRSSGRIIATVHAAGKHSGAFGGKRRDVYRVPGFASFPEGVHARLQARRRGRCQGVLFRCAARASSVATGPREIEVAIRLGSLDGDPFIRPTPHLRRLPGGLVRTIFRREHRPASVRRGIHASLTAGRWWPRGRRLAPSREPGVPCRSTTARPSQGRPTRAPGRAPLETPGDRTAHSELLGSRGRRRRPPAAADTLASRPW